LQDKQHAPVIIEQRQDIAMKVRRPYLRNGQIERFDDPWYAPFTMPGSPRVHKGHGPFLISIGPGAPMAGDIQRQGLPLEMKDGIGLMRTIREGLQSPE